MPNAGKVSLSANEIIASLSHSNLPTILVEGGDDIIVFRKLEIVLEKLNIDVLAAEGRNTLLEVYLRREEIGGNLSIAFVADRDCWVFGNLPAQFVSPALVFTDGYSIENDVFRDGNLAKYMNAAESAKFNEEIALVIECYALGLSRILSGQAGRIALHPNEIVDNPGRRLQLMELNVGEQFPAQLKDQIQLDFEKLLRGKTLMGLLLRQLSKRGHSSQSLMDIVANNRGPLLNKLFTQVEQLFV